MPDDINLLDNILVFSIDNITNEWKTYAVSFTPQRPGPMTLVINLKKQSQNEEDVDKTLVNKFDEETEVIPSSQPDEIELIDEIEVKPTTNPMMIPGHIYAPPLILLPHRYNPNNPAMDPTVLTNPPDFSLPPVWSYKVIRARSPLIEENKENEFRVKRARHV